MRPTTASLVPQRVDGVHYRRFVEYWKDGDLDRDKVADARKKLSS